MGYRMTYSRLIGALFIVGFVVYGTGFALTSSVIGAPDFLSTISAHQTTLILGAFLMMLVAPVDVGKAILFYPIVENHGKRTGKRHTQALIALARRRVNVVWAMLRDGTTFETRSAA